MDSVDLVALDFLVGAIAAVGVGEEVGNLGSSSVGLMIRVIFLWGVLRAAFAEELHS